MKNTVVFVRYWGSHFKNPVQPRVFLEEFRPLLALGWRCWLVLERMPEDPSWAEALQSVGVEFVILPRPRSRYELKAILRVYRLCRRLRPSILVCDNTYMPQLIGSFLARVPCRVWWKRDMNDWHAETRAPTWKERLAPGLRLAWSLSTRVIAISSAVREELLQLGAPSERVIVRCNPRKLGATARAVPREAARKLWGYSEREFVIATVGHAFRVKAWDVLMRAFARVWAAHPAARLLVAGSYDAPTERACFAEISRYLTETGLADKVRFTGHVHDVRQVLSASDVFAFPSRSEGCANALIEAIEVGVPCVATPVGNATEVIVPGVNGFFVERGDEIGLAKAVLKIAQDDELRKSMTRPAISPPCLLTLEQYVLQLSRDYSCLLSRGSPAVVLATDDGSAPAAVGV
jgi:glycosyltransferase involved in cell wall biosynthesis